MEGTLRSRAALITGVSRRIGIGFAIATHLASMGAGILAQSYAPYDHGQPWGGDPHGSAYLLNELRRYGTRVGHLKADFRSARAPALQGLTGPFTIAPTAIGVLWVGRGTREASLD